MSLRSIIFFTMLHTACDFWTPKEEAVEIFDRVDLRASVHNPEVPSRLWDQIEEQYSLAQKMDEYSESLDRKKTKISPPKKVFETRVFLSEKTPESLGGKSYELEFGASGNLLDLKDYLSPEKQGSFYLKFALEPLSLGPDATSKAFRVFHLSNVKELKIGKESLGGGCDQYRDITSYFIKNQERGFLATSRGARHMSLLAGTFVFVAVEADTLYFSSLTVTDSRFEKFLCRK